MSDSWFEAYWQAVAMERGMCLRRWPCHYASHQSLGWQMEALEDKTASVGGTKVKRRIATLLRVRKSEAVIINGGFLPWEFIVVFWLQFTWITQHAVWLPRLFSKGKLGFWSQDTLTLKVKCVVFIINPFYYSSFMCRDPRLSAKASIFWPPCTYIIVVSNFIFCWYFPPSLTSS